MDLVKANLDSMPAEVRREYVNILERLDANSIESPDPVYSKGWVDAALGQLGMESQYFGVLRADDRQRVRNTILGSLITEAYVARRQRDPDEAEEDAWHLAVRRGVEGYLRYDKAKVEDLDRGPADVWGSFDRYAPSLVAEREPIIATTDWAGLARRHRENQGANFSQNQVRSFALPAPAPTETAITAEEVSARLAVIDADPAEFVALSAWRTKLGATEPPAAIFERFRTEAQIAPGAAWNALTADQKQAFINVATQRLLAEELIRQERTSAARPEGQSEADYFAARRARALAEAESLYRTGARREAESSVARVRAVIGGPSEPVADPPQTLAAAAAASGAGTDSPPSWMATYEAAMVAHAQTGKFQQEADVVKARLAAPETDADRFLASVTAAKTRRGEQLDFNAVTWKGRNQQSAAYGAFWLSHGLLGETAERDLGTPPTRYTVEQIVASPELQYQAARAHVESLLATKLADGRSIADLPDAERAAALATAYRFGVDRLSAATSRRNDHWTASVREPAATAFAASSSGGQTRDTMAAKAKPEPEPAAAVTTAARPVATPGAITLAVPTAKDAAPVLAAMRGRSESRGMSEAALSDRARLETFYRWLLADVAGVTDPKVRAELERRVPQLRNLTDGAVSITAIDWMARDGKLTLDSGMQQYIGSSLGLDAAESADLGGYLRREAAEAARTVEKGARREPVKAPAAPVLDRKAEAPAATARHVVQKGNDYAMGV